MTENKAPLTSNYYILKKLSIIKPSENKPVLKIIMPEGVRKWMSLDHSHYSIYHIGDDEFAARIRNSANKFPVHFLIKFSFIFRAFHLVVTQVNIVPK